ncbi:MAG: prephenate dehydrogenase/arogenate dehydrogenase family protein [Phycisphaerae bacterium]|jgi:prephenate dehydrogenase
MAKTGVSFRHITIVGVGLLGGSAGLALKRAWPGAVVAGVGRSQANLDQALKMGAIDAAYSDVAEPAGQSDLIILATPVCSFAQHIAAIAPVLRRGVLVTDVGSTKAAVVRQAQRILTRGGPFVGSHPMAGSERKGAAHAQVDLFEGATCILTPTPSTPPALLARTRGLWQSLGMRTVEMSPAAHDRAVAAVSHLPHVLAAMLMLLPREAELQVSARGFADMTRLAGGDVEMWRDILLTNRSAILGRIDDFDERLMLLRDLVELGDAGQITRFLRAAKKRRDGLKNNRS